MNIDDVVLNFNPNTLIILNVVLGLIMLGIALDTSPDDALKRDFGYTPTRTSREAFEEYLRTHPGVARR
ncbi:hypothetical protein [Microbacterium pygmaeum]|uniref:Uncharacterized protein n=1 Tax=Microbacterium pygmaeum TaxID=370764 RepID=A0A1G8CY92_9MICO|nr:hypothetical protein [Microbacterium pygmaeum]SDH50435.1 hypothetical protein SAMN04489810_3199 [Microbacterium pygmaeum]